MAGARSSELNLLACILGSHWLHTTSPHNPPTFSVTKKDSKMNDAGCEVRTHASLDSGDESVVVLEDTLQLKTTALDHSAKPAVFGKSSCFENTILESCSCFSTSDSSRLCL
ncbi:hypothetical protein B0O99DRAFT_636826, partial [Bisporella sp. PMI_857]